MEIDPDDVLKSIRLWKSPVSTSDLRREFRVPKEDRAAFREMLRGLEERGQIERVQGRMWRIRTKPPEAARLTGTLSVTRKGMGFVRLDAASLERAHGERDVMVSELDLVDALDGDRVAVSVARPSARGLRGRIVEVITRVHSTIVGQYQRTGRGRAEVMPRSPNINRRIRTPEADPALGVKMGDWVVAEIDEFTPAPESLVGRIVERLGGSHEKGIDVLLLLRDRGIVEEFPHAVEEEVRQFTVDWPAELKVRHDLRDLPTATIDPITAKDFDDALSIEPLGKAGWRLWVHIADVSHFVRPGTALDDAARDRSTSVYPVDRVVPMLPERLSNDLCSLRQGEDRLAMTAEMEVDRDGEISRAKFYSSVIRSNQRLAYEQAQAYFDEQPGARDVIVPEMREPLLELRECARVMRKARFARGALDLDIPELVIVFHESGEVNNMKLRERFEAHMLVEDCMLAANEAVALELVKRNVPALFRVHETAEPQRLARLFPIFRALEIPLKMSKDGGVKPKDLQAAIKSLENRRGGHILRRIVLRALQRARYSEKNLGHFGLASKHYCHFTSPIRRYPDVVVHRQLRALERDEPLAWPATDEGREELRALGEHTSFREREAEDAERESETIKAIEYMEKFVGQEFDGIISGIQNYGIFIELQPFGIEGLVPVRTMMDDRYDVDELGIEMVGQRTGRRFRLTDAVRVRVVKARPFEMELDLEMVEGGGQRKSHREYRRERPHQPFYKKVPKKGKGGRGRQ